MGVTIRTGVALVILAIVSFPQWKTLPQAGSKLLTLMVLGGDPLTLKTGIGMLFTIAGIIVLTV